MQASLGIVLKSVARPTQAVARAPAVPPPLSRLLLLLAGRRRMMRCVSC